MAKPLSPYDAEDDVDAARPRWLGVLLAVLVVVLVAGLLMSGWFILTRYALPGA